MKNIKLKISQYAYAFKKFIYAYTFKNIKLKTEMYILHLFKILYTVVVKMEFLYLGNLSISRKFRRREKI